MFVCSTKKGKENERSFSHGSWTKTKAVRDFPRCSAAVVRALQDLSLSRNDRVQPVVDLSLFSPSVVNGEDDDVELLLVERKNLQSEIQPTGTKILVALVHVRPTIHFVKF